MDRRNDLHRLEDTFESTIAEYLIKYSLKAAFFSIETFSVKYRSRSSYQRKVIGMIFMKEKHQITWKLEEQFYSLNVICLWKKCVYLNILLRCMYFFVYPSSFFFQSVFIFYLPRSDERSMKLVSSINFFSFIHLYILLLPPFFVRARTDMHFLHLVSYVPLCHHKILYHQQDIYILLVHLCGWILMA